MSKKLSLFALVALTLFAAACDNGENKRCQSKADCGEGQICDEKEQVCKNEGSASVENVCKDVDCSGGGVCSTTGTSAGKCVNKETCEVHKDCVSGSFCDGGSCKTKEDICKKCDRGVCNEEDPTKSCVDAKDCATDKQCLKDNYCDKSGGGTTGTCELNYCDSVVECERGVCVPGAGQDKATACKNKETCAVNKDCLDNHICDPADHTCKELTDDLAKATCTGRMTYKAKEPLKSEAGFVCVEPANCANALDCLPGKVCDQASTTCTVVTDTCVDKDAGMYENDTDTTATAMPGAPSAFSKVDGTICPSDVDNFTYKAAASAEDKKLLVELRIDPFDVGVGNLSLTINGTAATVVDPTLLRAEINVLANAAAETEFNIKVSADDEMRATIPYTLTARVLGEKSLNSCNDAQPLVLGDPAAIYEISNTDPTEFKSACLTDSEKMADKVFKFTLTEKSFVTVDTELVNPPYVTLTLRKDCLSDEDELACARNTAAASPTIEQTLDAGTYFVLAQSEGDTKTPFTSRFKIKVKAEKHLCEPGSISCSGSTTSGEYQLCNRYGTGTTSGTCGQTNGTSGPVIQCVEDPAGDHCESARPGFANSCSSPIKANVLPFHQTGTIDGMTDALNPHKKNNLGAGGALNKCPDSPGKDVVAVVEAKDGERIYAKFAADYDSTLYIVKGPGASSAVAACADVKGAGCVGGVDTFKRPKAEEFTYDVPAGQGGMYYVVGDSDDENATGTYTLDIDVIRPTCTLDDKRCVGNDLEVCDATGKYVVSRTCGGTCNDVTKACDAEPSTMCDAAKSVTFDAAGNATVVGYLEDYTPNYAGPATSCGQKAGPGADATYTFTPQVGEFYEVKFSADFNANLLFTTDCDDLAGACQAGAYLEGRYFNGAVNPNALETVSFIAKSADQIKMIVDSDDATVTSGTFQIDIKKTAKRCTGGETRCKAGVSNVLEVCSPDGTRWETQQCAGACDNNSTPNSCDSNQDEVCATAPELKPGKTTGSIAKGVGTFNPGVGAHGLCYFAKKDEPVGGEKFYKVTVPPSEVLEVKVNPGGLDDSFMAYLLSGCGIDSCVQAIKAKANGVLRYVNNDSKPFEGTLVIDRNSKVIGSTARSFTIETRTYKKECDKPETPYACDNSKPFSKLKYCKEDLTSELVDCQFGCEDTTTVSVPRCALPPNDTCDQKDAKEIAADMTITANLKDYTNKVNWENGNSSCDRFLNRASGPDAIYKLPGTNKGKIVVAKLTKKVTNKTEMRLYASTSCSDKISSCEARAISVITENAPETLKFRMPDDGSDVYLYVDTTTDDSNPDGSYPSYPFMLEVSYKDSKCTPNSRTCDAGNLKLCDGLGENDPETLECSFGCSDENSPTPVSPARCSADGNMGNTCVNAHYFDTTTGEQLFFFDNHRDFGKPAAAGCNSFPPGLSDDTAYFVFEDVPRNSATITVKPVGFHGQAAPQVVVAAVSGGDCGGTGTDIACRDNLFTSAAGGKKTLTARVGDDRKIYFAVTAVNGHSSGAFKVSVESQPSSCTDGEAVCAGKTIRKCSGGAWTDAVVCATTCAGSDATIQCAGDSCAAPVEITGDASKPKTKGSFKSRPDPYKGYHNIEPKCKHSYPYRALEHFIHVKGNPEDYFVLTAEAKDTRDIALYLVKHPNCVVPTTDDQGLVCESSVVDNTGPDINGDGDEETLVYQLDSQGEAYFVIDAYHERYGEKVDYTVTYIKHICNVGDRGPEGCSDGSGEFVQECNATGTGYNRVDCLYGCNGANCAVPPVPSNDACGNAIEITGTGGVFKGDLQSADNTISSKPIASGGCGSSEGNDVFYRITGNSGDEVNLWLVGLDGPVTVYTHSSCKSGPNDYCYMKSHRATKESAANDNAMSIRGLTIPSSGDLYVVVDQPADQAGKNSRYVLYANIGGEMSGGGSVPPLCTANEVKCEGGHYKVCSSDGQSYDVDKDCKGVLCTLDGGCGNNTNSTCDSAPLVDSGESYTIHEIDSFGDTMASCNGTTKIGSNAVYQFSLDQGQVMKVDIASRFQGHAYIMPVSECKNTKPACSSVVDFRGVPASPASVSLSYKSTRPDGTRYALVVKADSGGGALNVGADLTFTKIEGCEVNTVTCENSRRTECGPDGLPVETYCAAGCDNSNPKNPVCKAANNTTCDDGSAYELLAGQNSGTETVKGTLKGTGFSFIDMSQADSNSCDWDLKRGYGMYPSVYAIKLAQDDIVNFKLKTESPGITGKAALFVMRKHVVGKNNCGSGAVCIFGELLKSNPSATYSGTFTAEATDTFYFIVAANQLPATNPDSFTLTVEKNPNISCTAGEAVSCKNGELKTCVSTGNNVTTETCAKGCSTTEVGCVPSGKSCNQAFPLVDGQAVVRPYTDGFDKFSPAAGQYNNNQCDIPEEPTDQDTFYKVYLKSGQTLTAMLGNMSTYTPARYPITTVDSGNDRPMLFLLDEGDCSANACLKNDAGRGYEAVNMIEYTATKDGNVYLVVDSHSSNNAQNSDKYTLQVFIN